MQEESKKVLSPREEKEAARQRQAEERVNAERALRHEYTLIAKTPAFLDLVAKIKGFSEYHLTISKDGMGLKQSGESSSLVALEPHERLRELDKSAGIDEIGDYIERKLDSKP